MTESIAYNLEAQVTNGPSMLKSGILTSEAYEIVNALIEAGSDSSPVNVQPSGVNDIALFFITSDVYSPLLHYATHAPIPATAGYNISGASPSTDISAQGADAKINIQADLAPTPTEVTVDATLLDSGAEIASAIEDAIQAIGGIYAAVTFVYAEGLYKCTSGTTGISSKIRLTIGSSNDICQALKMGTSSSPP